MTDVEIDDSDAEEVEWEECPTFQGECTCDHEWEHHGWGECRQESCPCEAGWEE